jgi:peptidoglycan/xylan/chitin deacetylase (PgdA/CDA1 family)
MYAPGIVTTSWDDGDPLDLKLADLLRARGLPGTFYSPFRGHHGSQTLGASQLRSLASEGFEVGGHTMSHTVLPELSSAELAWEVGVCKRRLEDILGRRVRTFCYPKGRFNANVIRHVKEAGYDGARTTRMFRQGLGFSPFRAPTSLQASPNTTMQYTKNLLKGGNIRGLCDYVTQYIRLDSWVSIGKALFDKVLKEGGVWHLYGHSWQVEELGLWDDLKEILDYVKARESVHYLTNAEVLTVLSGKTPVIPPIFGPAEVK